MFEFGFGLSYTTFKFSNLTFSSNPIGVFGKTTVSCDITNTGDRAGSEVAQLYIRDKISSVVRPVKELKGFEKIWLEPGESKQVSFILGFDELKMLDVNMNWVVEPGEFNITIGSSSKDIRLNDIINIIE